jgi:hypothetical protein
VNRKNKKPRAHLSMLTYHLRARATCPYPAHYLCSPLAGHSGMHSHAGALEREIPIAHRPSPIAHRLSPIAYRLSPIAHRPSPCSLLTAYFFRLYSRPPVSRYDIRQARRIYKRVSKHCFIDHLRYLNKGDTLVQESLHGHLVCRI